MGGTSAWPWWRKKKILDRPLIGSSETKKQKLTEHKADIPEMNSEKESTPDQLELEDSNFKGKLLKISSFLLKTKPFSIKTSSKK